MSNATEFKVSCPCGATILIGVGTENAVIHCLTCGAKAASIDGAGAVVYHNCTMTWHGASRAVEKPEAPTTLPKTKEMGYLPRLAEVAALLCGDRVARCAGKEYYPFGLAIRGIGDAGEWFIEIPDTTVFDYGWLIERLGREALRAVEWLGSPDAFAKYVTSQYVVRTCHDEVQLLLQDDWRSFTMPPSDIQAIETAFTTFFAGLFRPEPEASS